MSARTRIARRLAAALAAAALLLLLVLAWDLRPALPTMPQSVSQPLPGRTIGAVLDLAAWTIAVLLDLVLLGKLVQFALRKAPSLTALRLHHAFAGRERPQSARRDWRMHAAPLAPPVLRLPALRESEPQPTSRVMKQSDPHKPLAPVGVTSGRCDDVPGVLLLGPLVLTGCVREQPRRRATAALIAYLAVHQRRASRDELLEALWPGDDPRRSSGRFYQAVSEARKLLGCAFERDRDSYTLALDQLRLDTNEIDRLQRQADAAAGEQQQALLEQALALFRGEPLANIDALWALGEQRRLTALRGQLLERLAGLRLRFRDPAGALEAAMAAAALDAANERPVQLAMQAEAALGRRDAVADRYEQLRADLNDRYGLEPSRETRQLYRSLLSQDAASA